MDVTRWMIQVRDVSTKVLDVSIRVMTVIPPGFPSSEERVMPSFPVPIQLFFQPGIYGQTVLEGAFNGASKRSKDRETIETAGNHPKCTVRTLTGCKNRPMTAVFD